MSGQTSTQSPSTISVTAPTGTVNVNATVLGGNTQGAISVIGGSTVAVNSNVTPVNNSNTVLGSVTVTGAPATTSVTVNQAPSSTGATAVTTGVVSITDSNALLPGADSISTVSLSNYGNNSSINSSALSNLSLSGVFDPNANLTVNGNIDAANQNLTALNLNLSNFVNSGTVALGAANAGPSSYTTVNLQSSGLGSSLGQLSNSSSNFSNLNISGSAPLTLSALIGLTSNGTITSTSSGGVNLSQFTLGAGQGYNGALSTGNDSVSIANTTRAINVGNGDNTVQFNTSTISASVTAGNGIDTATLAAGVAAQASSSNAFASNISGFDVLNLTTAQNPQTVNLANLDDISNVINSGTTTLLLTGFANNGTLTSFGGGNVNSNVNTVQLANSSGTSDVLNYRIQSPNSFSANLTANGIETINIVSVDIDQPSATNTLSLTATAAQTISISGNTPLTLNNTNTTITSLNASGLTGAFTWTSGQLAAASTIVGSATANNTVVLSAANASVNYTGGTGINDVTTGSFNDTVNGGTNADTLSGGAGLDVINSGGDTNPNAVDSITGGAGADTISIVGSPNAVIVNNTAGDSGVNTATSVATSVIATGFDRITGTTNGVQLDLPSFGMMQNPLTVFVNVQSLAGTDNAVNFAKGTFANGTFTFNPNGFDTLATYDTDGTGGTAFESVVLTGFIPGTQTSNTGGLNNIITLTTLNV